ncbi:MAG: NGG1p interacting factor NIF3 [Bdellovibrionales bacterium]|mgnify:CR=1 FL=1|nr:NGG1p interacting factor NIF3 [Bdellovibrionales bacterium]MBT3525203.1 NGG1p interacting factor NIF3 [Bdellovibrionales bacterium]MBT7668664.1 NGG1p interacting factor NIF3 [Bdellovibrionales bacterium]MBT7766540.1 NGG1p interacting factor NIF3 [Bdellovibrionales bacterium]
MYKLIFFVPLKQCEEVKSAMFQAGGGKIGNYDCCSWQVVGQGQFRPLGGSKPFVGEQDQIEQVTEYRVEMVCDDGVLRSVIAAMKFTHPYEEVAYDVIRLETV